MSIFKAYDIRGIVPEQLDEDLAYRIGRSFVIFLGCSRVVVGRDVRTSADAMFDALSRGITDQGADVIDIGQCDTPMLYYSAQGHPAAINITASHNAPEYNGFKLCRENAVPISGATGIKDIENICIDSKFPEPEKKGTVTKKDTIEAFVKFTLKFVKLKSGKRLKVVIDGANGAGTLTFPSIIEKIDADFIPLYMEPDGTFPNHEANPLVDENLADLQKKVLEEGADLGVSLDGDADRCMFVDENGIILRADVMGDIIAQNILKSYRGSAVLYDLRSTRAAAEDIEKIGGVPVKCRVGHAFIKQQMREKNAIFASELSGHFYFREHFFTESSAIAMINVLNMMDETGLKASELAAPVLRYAHSGEINFEVDDKNVVLKRLEDTYGASGEVTHLDGLSVDFHDWWFNVRASNTEPLLRLNLEAPDAATMEKYKTELIAVIKG